MTKYFYTLTILWQRDNTPNYGLLYGVADVPEGATQESVYVTLRAMACERYGVPLDNSTVVHYYLVRNEL